MDGSGDDLWVQTFLTAPVRRGFVPADRVDDGPQCEVPLGDAVDRFMQTLVLVVECGIAYICAKALGRNGERVTFLLQSGELFDVGLLAIRPAELLRALLSFPFVIVGERLEK